MQNDSFNLPLPLEFRGLHPDLPVKQYQRNLPHWRQEGATYFVTFRLADSIPQPQLQALKRWRLRWERQHYENRSEADWTSLAKEITTKTESWLDEGFGECELGQVEIARLVRDSLLTFQDEKYFTSCFVIMPNHVHVLIKPLGEHRLEKILKDLKGYTARQMNKLLNRTGSMWAEESYDRIVRDAEHLYRVVQYIGRNPEKAGLPQAAWYRWLHPLWQQAGWRFENDS